MSLLISSYTYYKKLGLTFCLFIRQVLNDLSLLRFLTFIVLFLLPLYIVFHVLINSQKDKQLADRQRLQEQRKEVIQLNARLIDQSLERFQNSSSQRDQAYLKKLLEAGQVTAIHYKDSTKETHSNEKRRSKELSQWLVNARDNREKIETWFKQEDLSVYSKSYLIFVLQEYSSQLGSEQSAELISHLDSLIFSVSGKNLSNEHFIVNIEQAKLLLSSETILSQLAKVQNPHLALIRSTPPQPFWSEPIDRLEENTYLYIKDDKAKIATGLPSWFGTFCLIWISILMLVSLIYIIYRERLAREKLDLASTVAHEFRTPLTGIGVLIDGLVADKEKDSKKVHEYLLKMKESTERLHQISEHFFIEGSLQQKNLKLKTIDIYQWLSQQWIEFTDLHNKPNIDYNFQTTKTLLPTLLDPCLLSLALQNILRNAHHYTKQGTITLSTILSNEKLGIMVSDTGKGMSNSLTNSACNKYKRGEDLLSQETEGLGLGLYLAQEIAQLHDGEITIDSEIGSGSKITLWIKK